MTDETASDRLASHYEELRKALEPLAARTELDTVAIKRTDLAALLAALASQSPPTTDNVQTVDAQRYWYQAGLRTARSLALSATMDTRGSAAAAIQEAIDRALSTQLPAPIRGEGLDPAGDGKLPLQDRIETILIRRLCQKRIEGYTLETAHEIAALATPSSPEGLEVTEHDVFRWMRRTGRTSVSLVENVDEHLDALASSPEGWVLVPREPTEAMWSGLARAIMLAWDLGAKKPRDLFKHLEMGAHDIPDWLRNEPEMQALDHVPSKGTRAVIIWRAMLAAAPSSKENKS